MNELSANKTAEQNIIGSILMDNAALNEIYGQIIPEMFYYQGHRYIYQAMLELNDCGQPIDIAGITDRIARNDIEYKVLEVINDCISVTATSATIKSNADIVQREYKVRAAQMIANLAFRNINAKNVESVISEIVSKMEQLNEGAAKDTVRSMATIVRENKDRYFKERTVPRLFTGFAKLDDTLCGLEGGDMIVIGARPSVGKSAFASQIVDYTTKGGKRVAYYNLEMNEAQVYERFVAINSGIGVTRLRKAINYLGDEEDKFGKANEELSKRNCVISSGYKSINKIEVETRNMDIDCLVIDYLQLMSLDNNRLTRREEIGVISRKVKSIASSKKIPVIVLSQLNRLSEGRDDKEPTMAEIRESGDIEQDASIIIMLWNLDEDENGNAIHKGCKIEKDRQGTKIKEVLKFNGAEMRFEETNLSIKEAERSQISSKKQQSSSPFKSSRKPQEQERFKTDKDGYVVLPPESGEEVPF